MRPALLAVLLAAMLVTTGCLGVDVFGPSRPPSDERALDAVDRTRAATAGVTSYRFSVDGTEASVVTAHPTERELRSVGDARGAGMPALDGGNVENVTVTALIDIETDRLLRTHTEVRVARGGETATVTVSLRYSGYDEPVDVERPSFDDDALWETGCPGG